MGCGRFRTAKRRTSRSRSRISAAWSWSFGRDSDTYRAVYIAKLRSAVYVLDVFRKKSTKGSNLPKGHRIRIEARLKAARQLDRET